MKSCSTSLVIREIQILTTMHSARMGLIKTINDISDGEDIEKLKPSCIVGENLNMATLGWAPVTHPCN
jgi:hypothetical protein